LAVIGLGALAPPAFGAFSAPVDVLIGAAANPQVATDADGDAALTWELGVTRVQARTLSAGGALGTVHELGSASGTSDHSPRVATDRAGDSVFAWSRISPSDGIFARRLSAAGTLSSLIQISSGGDPGPFFPPEVATDRDGDTVITWERAGLGEDRVQARTMTARGALGTVRNVSPVGFDASEPQVATDASGDSVITWVREGGGDGDNDIVQARTITVNGSLGPIRDISAPAGRAFAPEVASDADGDVIITWLRFDGLRDRVQARTMSAAGVLGTTFNLTSGGPSARRPEVATDAVNDSVFTWQRFETPDDRIQARTRIGGILGNVTNLSATGGDAFAQQVASDDDGDSVFVWARFDAANAVDRVQARSMNAAGGLAATQTLSAAGPGDGKTPQVAMAPVTGSAVATWERAGVVQASRGP
jgi:hypothetical protein